MKFLHLVSTLSILSGLTGSIYGKSIEFSNGLLKREEKEKDDEHEDAHGHGHVLLYEDESNAQYWSSLDKSNALCSTGKTQSPINFIYDTTKDVKAIGSPLLKYSNMTINEGQYWMNNGHSVQYQFNRKLDNAKDLVMVRDKTQWNLVQYHFHTPSEHHVHGKFYDTEVHFVHQTEDGKLHVVGFFGMVEEGDGNDKSKTNANENPWLAQLFKNTPTTEETPIKASIQLPDLQAMIEHGDGLYNYTGSLTTPPCTEGVSWLVAKHPFTLSMAQLRQLQEWMGYNARPTQINLNYHEVDLPSNFGSKNVEKDSDSSAMRSSTSSALISTVLVFCFGFLFF